MKPVSQVAKPAYSPTVSAKPYSPAASAKPYTPTPSAKPYTPTPSAKPAYSANPQPKPKFVSHSVDMVQEEQFSRPSRPGRARPTAARTGAPEKREEKQKPSSNYRRETQQSVPVSQGRVANQSQMASSRMQTNYAPSNVTRSAGFNEEKQPAKGSKPDASRISRPKEERQVNAYEKVQNVKSSEDPRTNYRQVQQNVKSAQSSSANVQTPPSQSHLPSRDLPKQTGAPSPSEQSLKRGYVEITDRCHVDALLFFPTRSTVSVDNEGRGTVCLSGQISS